MSLVLQFLGLPQLHLDDKPIATDRRKAIALLAYLAVNDIGHPRQRYSRESLSALFWPDYDQAKAFSNLRRTIWEVHQAIGEDWLITDRESVSLNANGRIDLDVARFQDLLSQSLHQTDIPLRIPLLVDTVSIYRNHFLTGFSLKDAPAFNEWAYAESEELRRKLAEALTLLIESHCSLNQAESAIPHARRLISLDPLNESAHRQLMEVYIQAGQHSAALKQYQTCEQILRKELNLDPHPETRELYKKIRKGEAKPIEIKEQTEPIAPRHNLPSQISTFIGREKEQNEIIHLIEKNRLVTLAGVGGIGKTRLSLQVGGKLLNDFPNGVWFISLDSLSDPALVPQTVISVLNIQENPNRPVIEILTNVLRAKTTLLILDNCEHLLDTCAQLIATLLQNCPNLKILATSRETLNMAGEAVYYLPSLSVPVDEAPRENLIEYESIQLFTERAALTVSSFALTKDNTHTVVDICRRVDGIPLAIELAAARVNILQVEEILKQLLASFALLASDIRAILPRHQTLHASMDWSWGLLTESEQAFMRQLSVFAGGWTLESAQAVCDGDALNLTNALVKKSLIVVNQARPEFDRRETGLETRYHFHEIVRQYAREKLVESGKEEKIRTRHLKYFLELSGQAEPALKGPTQMEWYARMNDERDNIRAALEWADQTEAESGLYISNRLFWFWVSSNLREGVHWLEVFLHKSESGDFPLARANALHAYGWLLISLEQFPQARSAALECLEIFRACGNQQGEADALLLLAQALKFLDNPTEATALHQQALALFMSLDDSWRQANALKFLGWDQRDHERAFTYWEKAIVLYREAGDQRLLADALGVLCLFRVLNGDAELAQKYLDEATLLWPLIRKMDMSEHFRAAKSLIALIRGDYEQAYTLLQEIMVRTEESGNRTDYLWARARLGYVALREGKTNEARDIFVETVREFLNYKHAIGVVFTLEGMAGLFVAINKPKNAAYLIGWADATREEIGDTRWHIEQADVDKIIAACLAKMGEVAFSDAYDEGQKVTLDEAVAYALKEN